MISNEPDRVPGPTARPRRTVTLVTGAVALAMAGLIAGWVWFGSGDGAGSRAGHPPTLSITGELTVQPSPDMAHAVPESAAPSTASSKRPATSKSPRPKPTSTKSATASPRVIKAYLTGYSYFDNTPPGSSTISNPIVHHTAGGTGTFSDPITVAVGHSIVNGNDRLDWPAGTRFYVPDLRRYFIAEDTCGDGSTPQSGPCHVGFPEPATTWLDLWIGGAGGTNAGANSCMDAITNVWNVVVNPADGYIVDSGAIYGKNGCTKQYGNTLVAP